MLRFISLGSGSSGNATVVESGDGLSRTRVLIDCGLPLRELDARLARAGLGASDLDAVFVTHEHADHVGHSGRLVARTGIPLWTSRGTAQAAARALASVPAAQLHCARDGEPISVGALEITPFTVPHDAREPLQLLCSDGAVRLGVLTDLGHSTPHIVSHLSACDALILECNHDETMLQAGSYPWPLKRRIAGPHGHLSNADAAALARQLCASKPMLLVAAHLSEENNRPDLARGALAQATGCDPQDIRVAGPVTGTDWIDVRQQRR